MTVKVGILTKVSRSSRIGCYILRKFITLQNNPDSAHYLYHSMFYVALLQLLDDQYLFYPLGFFDFTIILI